MKVGREAAAAFTQSRAEQSRAPAAEQTQPALQRLVKQRRCSKSAADALLTRWTDVSQSKIKGNVEATPDKDCGIFVTFQRHKKRKTKCQTQEMRDLKIHGILNIFYIYICTGYWKTIGCTTPKTLCALI